MVKKRKTQAFPAALKIGQRFRTDKFRNKCKCGKTINHAF